MLFFFVCSIWVWKLKDGIWRKINRLFGKSYPDPKKQRGDEDTESAMRAAIDNTESVPRAPVFAAFVPRDTHNGSNTKLRLCCCLSNKLGQVLQLEEKIENIYLDDEISEPMYLRETAYVFLSDSEGVIKLLQRESLQRFHIW